MYKKVHSKYLGLEEQLHDGFHDPSSWNTFESTKKKGRECELCLLYNGVTKGFFIGTRYLPFTLGSDIFPPYFEHLLSLNEVKKGVANGRTDGRQWCSRKVLIGTGHFSRHYLNTPRHLADLS